nr:MAG TPA: hypothetical protein [Caudoviricetes sp.]
MLLISIFILITSCFCCITCTTEKQEIFDFF